MMRVNCVDYLLKKFFFRLGIIVAKYPGYFLLVPVFLTLICVTGLQRVHYVMDSEYLFSPEQGPSKTERSLVESFFKMNYSHRFNPTRITRPGNTHSSFHSIYEILVTGESRSLNWPVPRNVKKCTNLDLYARSEFNFRDIAATHESADIREAGLLVHSEL